MQQEFAKETTSMHAGSIPLQVIPHDRGLPGLGQTFRYRRNCLAFYQRAYQRFGAVSQSDLLFYRMVTLLGPEANEWVLLDPEQGLSSQIAWNTMLESLFPGGLMLRDGAEHRYHRKLMTPAFSRAAMADYLVRMQPSIRQRVELWSSQGSRMRFYDAVKSLTLDLAAQVFMGMSPGQEADRINRWFCQAVAASVSFFKLPVPFTEYQRGLAGRRALERYFRQQLPEKKRTAEADMFARLAQATDDSGASFADEDVINHMIFLMMAAHDTTTSALSSVVRVLTEHPDWQDRLREEFAGIGSDELEQTDLEKMQLTSLVIREALRLYPPVPTLPRYTLRELSFGGYLIPGDTLVNISPIHTHHMPELWRQPDRFDPLRFDSDRAEHKAHRFAWIPFGGGVHKCLGLHFAENQIRLILFHLLSRIRLEKQGKSDKLDLIPIIHPRRGMPVRLHPINVSGTRV